MRLSALIVFAPLLLAATPPPQLPTPPGADCPARHATDKVLAMVPGEAASDDDFKRYFEVSMEISNKCAQASKLDPARHSKYFDYTSYTLGQLAAAKRLKQAGIPADAIDQALDIGPGRANQERKSFTQAEVDRITAALRARGFPVARLDDAAWQKIGHYAIFTSGTQRRKYAY